MKLILFALLTGALVTGCQQQTEDGANAAQKAFDRNSQTIKKMISDWENENLDYSVYAEDFYMLPTYFGAEDSISLEEMKVADEENFTYMDYELVNDLILLPGVNPETKEMNGSVRFYGTWKATLAATDSTPAKSSLIDMYHTFEFNDEGKIINEQSYGDFGGIQSWLTEKPADE